MFSQVNEDELGKTTENLMKGLQEIFNEQIICALIHGSTVKGGMIKDFSDLDVQVFLKETAFDEYGLNLDQSMQIQEFIGDMDFNTIGAYYLQMYFHNSKNMPDWYTPPVKGSYQLLYGELPEELEYNVQDFQNKMVGDLKNLKETIANLIRNFVDSSNKTLFRRVRYLSTVIFPIMYSFLSYNYPEPEKIWVKPKNIIYEELVKKYQHQNLSKYLTKFFGLIDQIRMDKENYPKLRETYKYGIYLLQEIAILFENLNQD